MHRILKNYGFIFKNTLFQGPWPHVMNSWNSEDDCGETYLGHLCNMCYLARLT